MSRRLQAFRRASAELLQAGCEPELLALQTLQRVGLDSTDGTDAALLAHRVLCERVRARRIEADDARQVAESSSAPFELRGYLRVRVAMLSRCEAAINVVGKNLLNQEVAA